MTAELLNYRKDGTPYWSAMTVTPVHDEAGLAYFYAAQADMTHTREREVTMRVTNDELERLVAARTHDLSAALEQKTALLHEVDHRVKNNLQVISSLMLLKARRTPEGEARDALQGMPSGSARSPPPTGCSIRRATAPISTSATSPPSSCPT